MAERGEWEGSVVVSGGAITETEEWTSKLVEAGMSFDAWMCVLS